MKWIRWFEELGMGDVGIAGGKNASLGEMFNQLNQLGVSVPDGFAVTSEGYWHFLRSAELVEPIRETLKGLERDDVAGLTQCAREVRHLILKAKMPEDLMEEVRQAYDQLCEKTNTPEMHVAVRSSATAEDLPTASFAGQQESFLHIHGKADLLRSVQRCFASLFTARAVGYREDMGFAHMDVGLSVGVQQMVLSDEACSGVMFTLDTETGFDGVIQIDSIYGLGENIVQGRVGPDQFVVHKAGLEQGYDALIWKRCGPKEFRLHFDEESHRLENVPVPEKERQQLSLEDQEVLKLGRWALTIENHYQKPMDIEWAKDAVSGELFIVQARPETVHSRGRALKIYHLRSKGPVLAEGLPVGQAIAAGKARVVDGPQDMDAFRDGEVLVTDITDPDWEPIMKKAAALVTERGGRTSHAAIVARELGIPAVVGSRDCRQKIAQGQMVTVSCVGGEGKIYEGELDFEVEEVDPSGLEGCRTQMMINLANPEMAFDVAQLPNAGVGLVRMEFVFASWVKVHPLALTRFEEMPQGVRKQIEDLTHGYQDKTEYFVDRLSQGIAVIAAAFHPKPVILRFSDFKTNEYSHLLGGAGFEPEEENPMLGWRGASRYYHPDFKEGFMLELKAVKRVREKMGLTNLKVMIPFCRTPEEGQRVLEVMAEGGLARGQNGLEVYVMAELPSNVLQADEFAALFDGFSIGSNDLTQLVLGVDRDSQRVSSLFDERNAGVKRACTMVIEAAKKAGIKVGICGQAPSDFPDFAAFLVTQGIDSISLTPDAILPTSLEVLRIEEQMKAGV